MNEHPIEDYGLIGNCETAALINPQGGIDWLCLPAFDGGSFFGALLDREKGGTILIQPRDHYEVARRYLDDSAVLETRFLTDSGTAVVTDFFVVARRSDARFYDFTSLHPTRKLVRTIALESGRAVRMRMVVRARPDYARRQPAWQVVKGGYAMVDASLFTSVPLTVEENDLAAEFALEPGSRHFAVLDYSDERSAPDFVTIGAENFRFSSRSKWRV